MRGAARTRIRALVVGLLASLSACAPGGTQMTDQGLIIRPVPAGDMTEISIENELRSSTGIWMGMKHGLAIEELLERAEGEYNYSPTSGGITSLRLGEGVYFSLYSYTLPNDLSVILVCGYSVWTTTGSLPAVIPAAAVRADLAGDGRTQKSARALYRKTGLRAISLYEGEENAFFYVDITKCPERDPGPPEDD